MEPASQNAAQFRRPTVADFKTSLAAGLRDFLSAPFPGVLLTTITVFTGWVMIWITWSTGQTYWLILVVLGFPMVGTLSAVGFYEISHRRTEGRDADAGSVIAFVWSQRKGQLPWLAAIIVVIFLFWFFLGHMIFALFLGLSPMTNVSSSLDIFLTTEGAMMLVFGTVVGAALSTVVYSISVMGMPMLVDRDVDFMTAMLRSMAAVRDDPVIYLGWGVFIAVVTLLSMIPALLGLFIAIPVLGHASWHLYHRLVHESETPARPA